jgi:hypothetical protein
VFSISADKVEFCADLANKGVLDKVELAASKNALNLDTKELFNIADLAEVIELNKLSFKALKVLFVVRVIEDDNIVNVEEEHNPVVHPKARKALNRV